MTQEKLYDEALSLFAQNQLEDAITAFKKLIANFPNFIEGHMGLAHAYERSKKYDEAIDAVKKAIELDPKDDLAYSSLSLFYQRKGMIDEAEEAMAKAATLRFS